MRYKVKTLLTGVVLAGDPANTEITHEIQTILEEWVETNRKK